jgi:hypothetical protein
MRALFQPQVGSTAGARRRKFWCGDALKGRRMKDTVMKGWAKERSTKNKK